MTREQWSLILPFIQAYVEGKTVTYRGQPLLDDPEFQGAVEHYSWHTPAPWTPETVPSGTFWIRAVDNRQVHRLVIMVSDVGLYSGCLEYRTQDLYCFGHSLTWSELQQEYEWSADRKDWKPCSTII